METEFGNNVFKIRFVFKSYYVVWKLFFYFISVCILFGFKSYYVVWKLIHDENNIGRSIGLNRTM